MYRKPINGVSVDAAAQFEFFRKHPSSIKKNLSDAGPVFNADLFCIQSGYQFS